jgi:hypothetical protein
MEGYFIHKAKLQSVGVFLHPPLIGSLTYGTFRGGLSPLNFSIFLSFEVRVLLPLKSGIKKLAVESQKK